MLCTLKVGITLFFEVFIIIHFKYFELFSGELRKPATARICSLERFPLRRMSGTMWVGAKESKKVLIWKIEKVKSLSFIICHLYPIFAVNSDFPKVN